MHEQPAGDVELEERSDHLQGTSVLAGWNDLVQRDIPGNAEGRFEDCGYRDQRLCLPGGRNGGLEHIAEMCPVNPVPAGGRRGYDRSNSSPRPERGWHDVFSKGHFLPGGRIEDLKNR